MLLSCNHHLLTPQAEKAMDALRKAFEQLGMLVHHIIIIVAVVVIPMTTTPNTTR